MQARRWALAMVAAGLALASSPASAERIARVVDGDTVVTASGEKVRLMHFDAPEIRGECPRERAMAQQATAMLQQLAASGLTLERRGRDRYGRTLATATTLAGADVAATLIRAGLAHPYKRRGPRGGWCMPGR
jgi:endonuclease YncB( thermonuclease family)